jgi:hypothetical protein
MKYKIGNTIFEAANLLEAITYAKQNSLTGKMVKVSDDTKTKTMIIDRMVTVNCVTWAQENGKWSRSTHRWTGTITEVSGQSRCPQHRK